MSQLRRVAKQRLKDARALLPAKAYDGGFYLCGYAVELALKARICKTLRWTSFPQNRKAYSSFYVHDLDVLLTMTGREGAIRPALLAEWSYVVSHWAPELRYAACGSVTKKDLQEMIKSAEAIVAKLL